MGVYRVGVSTGSSIYSGSNNQVQLWLVGQHRGSSLETRLRPAKSQVSWPEPGGGCTLQPGGRQILGREAPPALTALGDRGAERLGGGARPTASAQ